MLITNVKRTGRCPFVFAEGDKQEEILLRFSSRSSPKVDSVGRLRWRPSDPGERPDVDEGENVVIAKTYPPDHGTCLIGRPWTTLVCFREIEDLIKPKAPPLLRCGQIDFEGELHDALKLVFNGGLPKGLAWEVLDPDGIFVKVSVPCLIVSKMNGAGTVRRSRKK